MKAKDVKRYVIKRTIAKNGKTSKNTLNLQLTDI